MKKTALSWADFVAEHIPEEQGKKLRALVEAVPDRKNLLHGDYHTNNVMFFIINIASKMKRF
jgi:aminoglycoside phosphotransferase (APT) family kinase protein